jgi:cell division protease FtsH
VAKNQIAAGNVETATLGTNNIEVNLKDSIRWNGEANDGQGEVVPNDAANASDFQSTDKLKAKVPPNLRQENPELTALLEQNQVTYRGKDENGSVLTTVLINFLPIIFIIALIVFMSRQMTRGQQNVFGFGRSRARLNDPERPQVTFADVAGE